MGICDQLLQLLDFFIFQLFVQFFVELSAFDKHHNYCSSGESREMAPPHTMESKTPSPTTLIPGLEAMHITSNQPMKSLADELEEATKTKMDGDNSDTESIASRKSKEYDASAESDGATSFDEGNESMEYISPSKVIGKEKKQDSGTAVEGPDGLKTPDRAFLRNFSITLLLLLQLLTPKS